LYLTRKKQWTGALARRFRPSRALISSHCSPQEQWKTIEAGMIGGPNLRARSRAPVGATKRPGAVFRPGLVRSS
jgi:hypothetical protein